MARVVLVPRCVLLQAVAAMSVADVLHDAVADLDRYIAEQSDGTTGWGEANPRGPYFGELLDLRDRMNKLREKIDGLYADE